jgi:hypothetical protein
MCGHSLWSMEVRLKPDATTVDGQGVNKSRTSALPAAALRCADGEWSISHPR